jgi:hypothetical protein
MTINICAYCQRRIDGGLCNCPAVAMNSGGVSLRDYFAAAALTGLPHLPGGRFGRFLDGQSADEVEQGDYDAAAQACFRMADAMLKAREEGK